MTESDPQPWTEPEPVPEPDVEPTPLPEPAEPAPPEPEPAPPPAPPEPAPAPPAQEDAKVGATFGSLWVPDGQPLWFYDLMSSIDARLTALGG